MALTKKAERTRAKLLESARRLISERGFDHVSVEDITKDSQVAKGTFYHYFKCKEDVVLALSYESSVNNLENALACEGGVVARCAMYFHVVYRDCQWNGVRLIRQWLRERIENEASTSESEEALCNIYSALERILTVHQGEGNGELRADTPIEKVCRLMVGHFVGVITVWCMMNGSFNIAEDPENYTLMDIENLLGPFLIKE